MCAIRTTHCHEKYGETKGAEVRGAGAAHKKEDAALPFHIFRVALPCMAFERLYRIFI